MLTLIPSSPRTSGTSAFAWNDTSAFAWDDVSIVRGQVGNESAGVPWQGWYSSTYNGNATAPTLVFDGAVRQLRHRFGLASMLVQLHTMPRHMRRAACFRDAHYVPLLMGLQICLKFAVMGLKSG